MNDNYTIEQFCSINEHSISLNGKTIYKDNLAKTLQEFLKSAYKTLNINYPKFFKMDTLSKLAFLTADVILNSQVNSETDIALVFSNNASSLDTDRKHQKSISDEDSFYPSPSTFVYTLPNICLGEISIKHQLYSENSFFIFDAFNADHLLAYTTALLHTNKAEKVLCGWVNVDDTNNEAILFLVGKNGNIPFTTDQLNHLYNS